MLNTNTDSEIDGPWKYREDDVAFMKPLAIITKSFPLLCNGACICLNTFPCHQYWPCQLGYAGLVNYAKLTGEPCTKKGRSVV